MNPITPGPQTSEWKATVTAMIVGIVLMVLGAIQSDDTLKTSGSTLFTGAVAGYSVSRGIAKGGAK